jgi:hypothetical protein
MHRACLTAATLYTQVICSFKIGYLKKNGC